MTTDKLENALAFAASDEHSGDLRVILNQAKCACRTLAAELTRLRAALSETADGVTALPGMSVWIPTPDGRSEQLCVHRMYAVSEGLDRHDIYLCYSTLEALEAATAGGEVKG